MDVHALIYIYDLYPQTLLKHIFTCILLHSISLVLSLKQYIQWLKHYSYYALKTKIISQNKVGS